jgi:uncharacterized secreted protein with C-terminal beta-propeller domain
MMLKGITQLLLLLAGAMLVMVSAFVLFANSGSKEAETEHNLISEIVDGQLPTVGTAANLKKILASQAQTEANFFKRGGLPLAMPQAEQATAGSSPPPAAAADASGSSYSGTNVQVEGIDEADIVKTDGRYIYQVNHGGIVIAEAFPAEQMRHMITLTFPDPHFYPQNMYVDDQYLTVIGSSFLQYRMEQGKLVSEGGAAIGAPMGAPVSDEAGVARIAPEYFYYMHQPLVKAYVFDIQNKEDIKLVRELDVDGYNITSRKIGSVLYLVNNQYVYQFGYMEDADIPTPTYRDSIKGEERVSIDYADIYYFPGRIETTYLILATIDLAKPNQEVSLSTYLGSGQNVYMSHEHLYVAITQYDVTIQEVIREVEPEVTQDIAVSDVSIMPIMPIMPVFPPTDISTSIYKFALNQGDIQFLAKGSVPGNVLNQFSMDEYQGHLRIATTSGEMWRDDEFTSRNNIYILDAQMNISGKVEGLAPGERIYSARFMGEKGYIVTFRTVDPLYVIDLKDPTNPVVLGELKIPGFSNYLHPYDENHLIGFGQHTIEIEQRDWQGRPFLTAIDQGMKLSLFDVSDVNNPIEKHVAYIGGRGSSSEVLYNHKALLYSEEKNIFAFPVNVYEVKSREAHAFGEFTFQGAYVYSLDFEDGFQLKGRITHLDTMPDGQYREHMMWQQYNNFIQRILYIEETLYTLSNGKIQANDINSLQKINAIDLGKVLQLK